MCGIAGFFAAAPFNKEKAQYETKKMTDAIFHRGPDSFGEWYSEQNGIAFGFRRLAILDLHETGNQPMISKSGRFVIVFNGEIYNHLELKNELIGKNWRGHSDTEILLEAIDEFGFENALQKIEGMFSFALWDNSEKVLFLARDRMGEKPLFYSKIGNSIVFASELKALKKYSKFDGEINSEILPFYFRLGYIPAPYSIYKNAQKVKQGCFIKVSKKGNDLEITSEEYWSLEKVVQDGTKHQVKSADAEAIKQLEDLLERSVRQQMISDVPLGAFLSGGIDSSAIVALMQKSSSRAVKTFSIGFDDEKYNEAEFAKEIANYLNTDHTEFYVTAQDALNVIPYLTDMYDEPYGDSSAIPTYLVTKLARQHVTVSLSGDGGDELFFGYPKYRKAVSAWNKLLLIPWPLRQMAALSIPSIPSIFYKRPTLSEALLSKRFDNFFLTAPSYWGRREFFAKDFSANEKFLYEKSIFYQNGSLQNETAYEGMYIDQKGYLPDDLLVKTDRVAMANSLETRIPFLNHKVVEFAWRLPSSMKYRDKETKWILRKILQKHVPKNLWDRPKAGFSVPIESWLNRELKEWTDDLLSEQSIRKAGILNYKSINLRKGKYLNGAYNGCALWHVLMFQDWLQKNHGGTL